MKNKFHLIPLIVMSLTLYACTIFSDNGKWKEEWGTPELFLENAVGNKFVYMYEDEGHYKDTEFVIRDLIKEAGPFENISKKNPIVDRYFTYQGYWQAATSGPNFCYMSIWENGLITIHHKTSLGPHAYAYFSMDSVKATVLVDTIFEMITYAGESIIE